MSYIRKKKNKFGKIYAYEVTATWDPRKKQSRSVSKYLGIVDENGQIISKGSKLRKGKEPIQLNDCLIQDFGNGFLVEQSIKKSAIYQPLSTVFADHPQLLILMAYRLCQPGAMYNCNLWLEGNVLQANGSNALSSQDISRLLAYLGKESVQRTFFEHYLGQDKGGTKNVIIDATSLPNRIKSDFSAWGYNDGSIEHQFRFHCVVDQITKRPLFYRCVPGNIADVSTLHATMQELKALGVNNSFALVDAGYCSAFNIQELRKHTIDFLMRLPAGRQLYKGMIKKHAHELENLSNAVKFNQRSLFIKSFSVDDLYGEKGHLYMILDPQQKAKSIQTLIEKRSLEKLKALDKKEDKEGKKKKEDKQEKEDNFLLAKAGIFMLISSKEIAIEEILEAYYIRQAAEQVFGFSKSELDLLPIRCHCDDTVRGYLFLQFLLLIVFIEIRERLKGHFTVEQALTLTRNLKCKVYTQKTIVQELTKSQKQIFDLSSILVPT